MAELPLLLPLSVNLDGIDINNNSTLKSTKDIGAAKMGKYTFNVDDVVLALPNRLYQIMINVEVGFINKTPETRDEGSVDSQYIDDRIVTNGKSTFTITIPSNSHVMKRLYAKYPHLSNLNGWGITFTGKYINRYDSGVNEAQVSYDDESESVKELVSALCGITRGFDYREGFSGFIDPRI